MVSTGLWTGESLAPGILVIDIGLLFSGYAKNAGPGDVKPPAAR